MPPRTAAENERLQAVFLNVVKMVERHCHDGIASLSLVHDREVAVEVSPGLPAECLPAWGVMPPNPAQWCSGPAVHWREPVTACDIATNPLWEKHRAAALAHGLRACFSVPVLDRPVRVGDHELFISASVGAAVYPEHGHDHATLHRRADTAMYQAKSRGESRVEQYEPSMETRAHKRLTIENDLHRALERQELALHYQPQYCVTTGELAGLEALLRWTHPQLGEIPPVRFIPIAEQSGLLTGITNWALKEACVQSRQWKLAGIKPPKIALNISASQLARPDLIGHVSRALDRFGVPPSLIELELTESAVMEDVEESIIQIARLKELGIQVSIDDFGSGYSSLSYLRFLPVGNLKIDQSFLPSLGEGSNAGMVIRAIAELAHGLGITVTAEGVKIEEQLPLLRTAGCDYVQGYWLGRAMPAGAVTDLLVSQQVIAAGPGFDMVGAVNSLHLQ